ncbi:MAG: flagellar hook-associated protein FlgK [Bauldia sp.]
MGLTNALSSALSGLRFTQSSLQLTATNIANAGTAGYTRKSLMATANYVGGQTVGVDAGVVQRQLDAAIQTQFRVQSGVGQYSSMTAQALAELDRAFGSPGGPTSLDTLFGAFGNALSALATTPESTSARRDVLGAAGALAGQLNSLTTQVQAMRSQAEVGLRDATAQANAALDTLVRVDSAMAAYGGSPPADLLDQRDQAIDVLAQLLDINVTEVGGGRVTIATRNGTPLFDGRVALLEFDAQIGVTPEDQWSADPTVRSVGTLVAVSPSGMRTDLFADGSVRTGVIGALRDLRDTMLPEAQRQLDAIADQIARAASTVNISSVAASSGPANGFDIDATGLLSGNTITLDYRDLIASQDHRITFMRVDDPSVLPLDDNLTGDPTDQVIGIDFSGGMASVVAQMQAALGPGFTVSNPSGNTIRILDDGAAGTTDVNALSGARTATALAAGDLAVPLFVDAVGKPYTGAPDGNGQSVGFAGRINVNALLSADPSGLVLYDAGVGTGDAARPQALVDRLLNTAFTFAGGSGIGTATGPFVGSIGEFVGAVLDQRGEVAATATARDEAQQATVSSLNTRLSESAAVNIDEEMAHLVELQNAYAANARVMTVVKDLFDLLMRI